MNIKNVSYCYSLVICILDILESPSSLYKSPFSIAIDILILISINFLVNQTDRMVRVTHEECPEKIKWEGHVEYVLETSGKCVKAESAMVSIVYKT